MGLSRMVPPLGRFFSRLYAPFKQPLERYGWILGSLLIVAVAVLGALMISGHIIPFRDPELPATERPIGILYGLMIYGVLVAITYTDIREHGWKDTFRRFRGGR
jgi:hypothetical protein